MTFNKQGLAGPTLKAELQVSPRTLSNFDPSFALILWNLQQYNTNLYI